MSTKKIINSPNTCVDDSLYGLSCSYSSLSLHPKERTFFDTIRNENQKIAVLSGGGSGHEPYPSGYVGEGMLTASTSGSVFTSPPKHQILHAIRNLSSNYEGVFVIIPNYTGDRLNFGLAIETAKKEGLKVESVVVGEDIALTSYDMVSKAGRRGMCGLIFTIKIAGFLAKEGKSLTTINTITELVTENLASIGLCVEPCSLPGSGVLFYLEPDQVELGVGVHGEEGVHKMELKSARETVDLFLKHLIKHLNIGENHEVVALVNNLGSLSLMEQWIVVGELQKQLLEKNIILHRLYAGHLFTSLNMAGIQICLLKLNHESKELFLRALDEPTKAPAWPGTVLCKPQINPCYFKEVKPFRSERLSGGVLLEHESKIIEKCLMEGSRLVLEKEEYMNYLDSGCGDGDCGSTIGRFAKEIIKGIEEKSFEFSQPAHLFSTLGKIAEKTMGGTSGAIYGLFLMGASLELSKHSVVSPNIWGRAWSAGINMIKKYSQARIGDRTLLDALEPGCESFIKGLDTYGSDAAAIAFDDAVESAIEGCQKTQYMRAGVGRASYVETTKLKEMDAGAFGVTLWLSAFRNELNALRCRV